MLTGEVNPLLLVAAAAGIFFLPGAALLAWRRPRRRDPLEAAADALALSLAITALGGLGCFLLGLRWQPPMLAAGYGLLALILAAGLLRRRARLCRPGLILAAVLLLAAVSAWRFYQSRGLVLPAWVDSVHHVLVVNKILQAGGLPATLAPEIPAPFYYHYTFHLLAGLFSALTGLEPAQAVLWLGQALNAGVSLGVYRLAKAYWRDVPRALLALLLATFALQMPAYYLSWGRYPLLAGLILLAVGLAALLQAEQAGLLELVLLGAGAALAHYFTLGLLGLFAGLRLLGRRLPWRAAAALGGGGLLAGPWLLRVLSYGRRFSGLVIAGEPSYSWAAFAALLGPRHNHLLLVLAGAGLLAALARRRGLSLGLWSLLLVGLSLPVGPRVGPFRPDHAAITLFLPAAVYLPGLLGEIGGVLPAAWPRWLKALPAAVLAVGLLVWGGLATRNVINPATQLAGADDLAALAWVRGHTPTQARFLINARLWQAGSYRGVDGGYWLLPLTGRQSLIPPAMYGYAAPEFIRMVNDWGRAESQLTGCSEAFWALVKDADLDYAYVKGGVGSLQPPALENCPGVEPVYTAGSVHLYHLDDKLLIQDVTTMLH